MEYFKTCFEGNYNNEKIKKRVKETGNEVPCQGEAVTEHVLPLNM